MNIPSDISPELLKVFNDIEHMFSQADGVDFQLQSGVTGEYRMTWRDNMTGMQYVLAVSGQGWEISADAVGMKDRGFDYPPDPNEVANGKAKIDAQWYEEYGEEKYEVSEYDDSMSQEGSVPSGRMLTSNVLGGYWITRADTDGAQTLGNYLVSKRMANHDWEGNVFVDDELAAQGVTLSREELYNETMMTSYDIAQDEPDLALALQREIDEFAQEKGISLSGEWPYIPTLEEREEGEQRQMYRQGKGNSAPFKFAKEEEVVEPLHRFYQERNIPGDPQRLAGEQGALRVWNALRELGGLARIEDIQVERITAERYAGSDGHIDRGELRYKVHIIAGPPPPKPATLTFVLRIRDGEIDAPIHFIDASKKKRLLSETALRDYLNIWEEGPRHSSRIPKAERALTDRTLLPTPPARSLFRDSMRSDSGYYDPTM